MIANPDHYISYLSTISLFAEGVSSFDKLGTGCIPYKWENWQTIPMPTLKPLKTVLIWLGVDTVIYVILYAYIRRVCPSAFSIGRSLLFPLDVVYNCYLQLFCTLGSQQSSSSSMMEDGSQTGRVVVQVRGLVKIYKSCLGSAKNAVNNVDLDINRNRITVLLGHNDCGKTTTMSIICGFLPATKGTVCVDGSCNVNHYRHKIGYCPQHNIVLPYLTCVQHLYFFGVVTQLPFRIV